jgi:hypothetical protein
MQHQKEQRAAKTKMAAARKKHEQEVAARKADANARNSAMLKKNKERRQHADDTLQAVRDLKISQARDQAQTGKLSVYACCVDVLARLTLYIPVCAPEKLRKLKAEEQLHMEEQANKMAAAKLAHEAQEKLRREASEKQLREAQQKAEAQKMRDHLRLEASIFRSEKAEELSSVIKVQACDPDNIGMYHDVLIMRADDPVLVISLAHSNAASFYGHLGFRSFVRS